MKCLRPSRALGRPAHSSTPPLMTLFVYLLMAVLGLSYSTRDLRWGTWVSLTLGMWDLSSPTKDQTQVWNSCIGRWFLSPWPPGKVVICLTKARSQCRAVKLRFSRRRVQRSSVSSDHVWTTPHAVIGLGPLDREQMHLLLCLWPCGSLARALEVVSSWKWWAPRRPSFRNGI